MGDLTGFFSAESTSVSNTLDSLQAMADANDTTRDDSSEFYPGSSDLDKIASEDDKQKAVQDGIPKAYTNMIAPLTIIGLGEVLKFSKGIEAFPGVAGKVRWAAGKAVAVDLSMRAYSFFKEGSRSGSFSLDVPFSDKDFSFKSPLPKMTEAGSTVVGVGAGYGTYATANYLIEGISQGIQVGKRSRTVELLARGYYESEKLKNIVKLTTAAGGGKPTEAMIKAASGKAQQIAKDKVDDAAKILKKQLRDQGIKGIDDIVLKLANPTRAQAVGAWLARRGRTGLSKRIIAGTAGLVIPEAVSSFFGAGMLFWAAWDLYGMVRDAPELYKLLFEEVPVSDESNSSGSEDIVQEYPANNLQTGWGDNPFTDRTQRSSE